MKRNVELPFADIVLAVIAFSSSLSYLTMLLPDLMEAQAAEADTT
jgi:hypothetical protein